MRAMRFIFYALFAAALANAAKPLDVYFVDVEGGQATLIVTPSKQSILVDTGWPGYNGRDAMRIKDAAKAAGVKQIDYLILTHYHTDHVGGITQLVERIPVKTFVDHGPNRESGKRAEETTAAWDKAVSTGSRLSVKPGDKLPLKGVDLTFVTADGNAINSPINGGGAANAFCEGKSYPDDPTENARSTGFVLTYGKFRMLDIGDLTSKKELDLVCPTNKLGKIDLYLTTHHGTESSNSQAIVHAIAPRVAVMNNGAKKGGAAQSWQTIRSSPGLEDLWQVHFAVAGGKDNNSPDSFIANIDEACEGKHIKVSAMADGSFTVLNARNKYQKTYAARQ